MARHIVSEAHRERVRLRRTRPPRVMAPAQRSPAPEKTALQVVVGVDGSDGSRRAPAWAAREASAHGGRLTACWTGHVAGSGAAGSARSGSDSIEDELVAVVACSAPSLDRDRQQFLVLGPVLEELVALADHADLLVVARPHEHHFAVSPSGAVTRRVIDQCSCPVLLIP
jgi:nucleotide-binding universal stress UspA family protein